MPPWGSGDTSELASIGPLGLELGLGSSPTQAITSSAARVAATNAEIRELAFDIRSS